VATSITIISSNNNYYGTPLDSCHDFPPVGVLQEDMEYKERNPTWGHGKGAREETSKGPT